MPDPQRARVVPLEEGRRSEVFRFYEDLFGSAKASWLRRRFDWQYARSPSRKASQPTNWAVLEGDRLIGHYGMIHIRMLVDRVEVQGCWACDLVVHPEHRRGRHMLELFALLDRAADLPMGYGMADHVLDIYSKRGYLPVGIRSHLIRFLGVGAAFKLRPAGIAEAAPVARRANEIRARLRTALRHLSAPDSREARKRGREGFQLSGTPPEGLDALWAGVSGGYPVSVVRDHAHLAWRYDPRQTSALYLFSSSCGRPRACLVLEAFLWRGLRVGQIAEILVDRGDVETLLPGLVSEAVSVLTANRMEAVLTEGFPQDIRRVLERSGFLPLERATENFAFLDRHGQFDRATLAESDNWLLGPGDSDRSTPYPRLELGVRSRP